VGFRVWGLGSEGWGLGAGSQGLGIGVWGVGLRWSQESGDLRPGTFINRSDCGTSL